MPSPRALLLSLVLGLACLPRPAAAATVTVLYFDNDSGDAAFQHLGKGLADMMITDLSAAPGVQVVEREKLEALLKELKLQRSRYFDPKTAQRIGKGLGAEYAVTGSFVSVSPKLRLDVRVLRIASGEIVKAHQVTGQRDQFFDLYQRLVASLLDGLAGALQGGGAAVKAAAGKNRVDDVGAALDFGQALEQRDSGDLKGASQSMQKAMERAPGFGLARARYMQIMKELYAAREVRTEKLSGAEGTLLASSDLHLAQKGDAGARFAYRILRGHLLFRRVASALGRPARQYLPLLAAYRENQERLVAELVELEGRTEVEYNPEIGVKSVAPEDTGLARELGLPFPSTTTANKVMLALVGTTILGLPPYQVDLPRRVCFFKAEPALLPEGRKLLKQVQERIDRRAAQYKKLLEKNRQPVSWAEDEQAAQTIDLIQSQAQVDLAAGKREEAIARLQGLLTRYPKSRKFEETEQMIRAILDGSDRLPDGTPLVGCEDPR